MGVRKNQNTLSAAEKARFVAAVKKMKADAAAPHNYNKYVTMHATAFSGGTNANPAHLGPAFFPWHRYFLLKFENDLKAADTALGGDGTITLPYWDWTHDNGDGPGAQRGGIWKDDLLGGFGNPVTSGPFRSGQWTLAAGGSLVRALGRSAITPGVSPSLPEKSHADTALGRTPFDVTPFDDSVSTGMRNFAEGWVTTRSEPEMHNRVHVFVGGSMLPGTSPDDPVFFMHHCNVDRLWALWQFRHPGQNYPVTVPNVGVPGNRPHGLNDLMPPWTAPPEEKRPIDMLNHTTLGYTYDTDPVGASINVSP